MVKGLIILIALAISATMTALARRRAQLEEARGGCVACGAQELAVEAALARCRACGYVGAADRGGALTDNEIHSLHGLRTRRVGDRRDRAAEERPDR